MKKNILITVYDMEIGGVERSLINMLRSFDYERYDVDVLVCSHRGELLRELPAGASLLPERGAYTVFRKSLKECVREGRGLSVLVRMLVKALAAAKAKRLGLTEGSGYIQLQLTSSILARMLPPLQKRYAAAISYAWPHDFVAHRVQADKKLAWIHTDYSKLAIDNKLDERMWAKYDGIASISDACSDSFLAQYPGLSSKLSLIENITSPSFIRKMAEAGEAPELKRSSFNIVSVGRLSYVKGFDMAVEAMLLLKKKGYAGLKWHIVGFGGSEAELRSLIERHGLQEQFILLGKQENPYPYIKACDLYVQPSRYEGKAVTVTEAQILGKPVLITRYPTSGSQVREGVDGVFCEVSPEAIAAGIERLYKDERLRQLLSSNLALIDYGNSGELNKLYRFIEGESKEGGERIEGSVEARLEAESERHYSRV
ncbi:glycosyltransferase [Paenibacillus sp. GCM10027627]|uniref:glycosyltransferase n=1 Tax=unclassified Paenibacillus TaxID=185978 RepID=UPI003644C7B2